MKCGVVRETIRLDYNNNTADYSPITDSHFSLSLIQPQIITRFPIHLEYYSLGNVLNTLCHSLLSISSCWPIRLHQLVVDSIHFTPFDRIHSFKGCLSTGSLLWISRAVGPFDFINYPLHARYLPLDQYHSRITTPTFPIATIIMRIHTQGCN